MASLKRARITPDRDEGLIAALHEALEPDLVVEGGDALDVGFIRRRVGETDVRFVSNISEKARRVALNIPGCGEIRLFDPMELADCAPVEKACAGGRTRLVIDFEPNQSLVLVSGEAGLAPCPPEALRRLRRVTGWTLTVGGETVAEGMDDPIGWERFEHTRHFSGDGEYAADFTLAEETELWVELHLLDCCCDVLLDGEAVASLWKAPLRAKLGKAAAGAHRLSLCAVSTWINHVIGPENAEPEDAPPVVESWPYFSNIIADVRRRRLSSSREREAVKAPQPSGVSGPVYLLTRA
jgi:hypothetical protein